MAMLRFILATCVLSGIAYQSAEAASLWSIFSTAIGGQEEVTYTSVGESDGLEERRYAAKKWVCTEHIGGFNDNDQLSVFSRLFGYLDRENDREEKITMGTPVSIEVKDDGTGKKYSACFFIPEAKQANPPVPTNSLVKIVQRPAMTVLTRRFGGYANDEATWTREQQTTSSLITRSGRSINPSTVYWNAYDSPLTFFNRRNEVWLIRP